SPRRKILHRKPTATTIQTISVSSSPGLKGETAVYAKPSAPRAFSAWYKGDSVVSTPKFIRANAPTRRTPATMPISWEKCRGSTIHTLFLNSLCDGEGRGWDGHGNRGGLLRATLHPDGDDAVEGQQRPDQLGP